MTPGRRCDSSNLIGLAARLDVDLFPREEGPAFLQRILPPEAMVFGQRTDFRNEYMIGEILKQLIPSVLIGLALIGLTSCAGSMPSDLGANEGLLGECPDSPNCISSNEADSSHRADAFVITGDAALAWQALIELVEATPSAKFVTRDQAYLHVEFTSSLMDT